MTAVAVSAQLGGTERVLLDLATHAASLDVDLRVLVPIDGPLVARLGEIGIPTDVVPGSHALLRSSQQEGYLWSAAPAVAGLISWARKLERHPYLFPGVLAYTIGFKAHLAVAMAQTRPSVWHLHEFPPARTGRAWRALAHRLPDALVANSEAVGAAWASATPHAPRHGTTVVLNGIDLTQFQPRTPTKWIHDELGIPRERRLVGMPAVLARWKGHMEVIEAFRAVQGEFPETDLVLVGGSIYDTLAEQRYAKQLKDVLESSHSRIHLLPFQQQIERVFPEFDITVHYSLRSEPFGRVILESMASGVPVVAADEGGPKEILGTSAEEVGWLATPRKPDVLASVLRSALGKPASALADMGARSRKRAEAHFSSSRFAGEIAELFRLVAPARPRK